MEYCDVYDEHHNPTGEIKIRNAPLGPGQYHLLTCVWVVGPDGRVLLQKRSHLKRYLPDVWSTHSGGALVGENSRDAAARELWEEIGVRIEPQALTPLAQTTGDHFFMDHYITLRAVDLRDTHVQEDEVAALKWADIPELRRMIASGEFFDYPALSGIVDQVEAFAARQTEGIAR